MGALIGMGILCAAGFEAALFFIPRSWGGVDDDGEFVATRHSLALFLGLLTAVWLLWLLHKREALSRENSTLRAELQRHRKAAASRAPKTDEQNVD